MPVQFQLHMLQLVVGNSRHVTKLTSTGSVALCAPSSALLMAKAVQCMHVHGLCALQSFSCIYCSTVTECMCIRDREKGRERGRESYLTYTAIAEERKGNVHVCMRNDQTVNRAIEQCHVM